MTTTTSRTTRIETDPDVPLIRIAREFDASPAQVFRAHSDPGLVVQWLGPRGYGMTLDHYDCRTGGSYRYVHVTGQGDATFFGSFHEVRPGELIVQTFTYEGWPDAVALERLTFTDAGGGRTLLQATSMHGSVADRDAMIASGMEKGVVQGYERLDELLPRC